jgi:hypothetical protein
MDFQRVFHERVLFATNLQGVLHLQDILFLEEEVL